MKKITKFYLVPTVIFLLFLIQYFYNSTDFKRFYSGIFKCIPNDIKRTPTDVPYKHILYWTGAFGHADFYLGFGSKIFEGCEVSNCFATDNRCYMPMDQFDAILFHGREYIWETQDKPDNRTPSQIYIYVNQESPANTPKWIGSDNFFNWTMTYRLDSDVAHVYGYFYNSTTGYKMPTADEIQRRPHKIAWMVSNCKARSNRKELYDKLSKYIPIDVYGDCGNMSCPKNDFTGCYDQLTRNYKFYLSFENSVCKDYVTEKMYMALMRDIVPIGYGGVDYAKFSPPHSVIDAAKFDTVEELAEYILSLDADPAKYLEYFEWKKRYTVLRDHKPTVCSLCKKLHEPLAHKSYDIEKWWTAGTCRYGKDLPKIALTLDSDVIHRYGYAKSVPSGYKYTPPTVEEVQKRPGKIAWMVSNCDADSNRWHIYEGLAKYFPIDIYGRCGKMFCPMEDNYGCYDFLERNYKFYLSFENSVCKDYVTEKLFSTLMRNLIPLVYGGANYSVIAPRHSVIDVTRFDSVEQLAKYLKFLDDNPKRYLAYFEWKKYYVSIRNHVPTLCDLCKKLNEPLAHKTVDIEKWFREGICRYGKDLPKIALP